MVEEQYLEKFSSSLIIYQQIKINSSLTNKTIQLLKHTNKTKTTQKTTNKII